MRELSLHILDLAQNSIAAEARNIRIDVIADTRADRLAISITDDGKGMDPDFLARVKDPFTTTRKTRRVGMGIPMFTEAARACDGELKVKSKPGDGTSLVATFKLTHIDRAPLGDIATTLITLVAANPNIDFVYMQKVDDNEFVLDTKEIKTQLDGVPINEASVLKWIREYVETGTSGELEVI